MLYFFYQLEIKGGIKMEMTMREHLENVGAEWEIPIVKYDRTLILNSIMKRCNILYINNICIKNRYSSQGIRTQGFYNQILEFIELDMNEVNSMNANKFEELLENIKRGYVLLTIEEV